MMLNHTGVAGEEITPRAGLSIEDLRNLFIE